MDMSLSKGLGDDERQGSLVCCSPWGHRVGPYCAAEQQQYVIHRVTVDMGG